ncbi:MAG TPA: tRNA (guanosine(46)-N7)-methyltransferase TrmB [Xanthomonadaceae bacterium]|nr:tRNA (guanosine(46)-N7)-methyltransferase TrmB [Xanthomonadaceae bacterium]
MTGLPIQGEEHRHRRVRSFVRREGRLTPGQARALAVLWPRFGLDADGPVDLDAAFGRRARRVLEIGFGNGEVLLAAAAENPEQDFLGIEVHRPGVGRLLLGVEAADLRNVRVFCHDAVEVLAQLAEHSIDEVRVFFPDPWHKKRHHKRRLIQPGFVDVLAPRLVAGGRLHLATDWEPYAEHMREVMEARDDFVNEAGRGRFAERPASRPQTHFEKRGLKLGHQVFDLLYRRS